jgi:hydrogenase expression/formation protein HypD
MKYLDEYRVPETVKKLVTAIKATTTQPWNIMEVCGGQTHSISNTASISCCPTKSI